MPSQLYPKAREKFLTAQLNWMTATVKAIFLPESYEPDFTDQFLVDVFEGVRIAISEEAENKSATDGFANSDPIKFPLLVDPRGIAKVILFNDTGSEATSDLIAFLDKEDLVGVVFEPVGLDYFVTPMEGGFFRL